MVTLIGGYIESGYSTRTTELVTIDPPSSTQGPNLIDGFREHCSVILDHTVYLIGGASTLNKVLAISIRNGSMDYVASLKTGRDNHACAPMLDPSGETVIVVAGGYDVQSTELYSIKEDTWKQGKS